MNMKSKLIAVLLFIGIITQAQTTGNILFGSWKVIRTASTDLNIPLTKEELKQAFGVIVTFKLDRIEVSRNKFIDGCNNPKYKIKTVNALKYYDNDRAYLKMLGVSTKFVKVVDTGCGLPCDAILIINNNLISIGMDGYCYFLSRVINNAYPSNLSSSK